MSEPLPRVCTGCGAEHMTVVIRQAGAVYCRRCWDAPKKKTEDTPKKGR